MIEGVSKSWRWTGFLVSLTGLFCGCGGMGMLGSLARPDMVSGCDSMEYLSDSELAAVASVRGSVWDNRGDCDRGATGPGTWGG